MDLALKTILLLHEDLGFVFWLGHILDQAGYEAYPARMVSDAFTLIADLCPQVDLVVCDPQMDGVGVLLAGLSHLQPSLKVVFVESSAFRTPTGLRVTSAVYPKPEHISESTKAEWLQLIAGLEHSSAHSHSV
jgi:hypothetical protein